MKDRQKACACMFIFFECLNKIVRVSGYEINRITHMARYKFDLERHTF